MLTKPQVFYDNAHKQALGYQNPFYLKKAQRIKPTLYDGIVISDKHVVMPVIDDEETLILEEESRSKMSEKEKDPEAIKQNISHKPIDYVKLNRLSEDLGKHFVSQQELTAKQAFWFHMSNPTLNLLLRSLAKWKLRRELIKIRTTPDAHTEGEWGFEHTKSVFNNEIIPFLKSLKDIFNVFDKDLLNEIMEQIMSQDVLLTMMNSMSSNGKSMNMERKRNESCDKCFNLDAELFKTQNAHNDLLKSYSQLEKHCISLELSIQLNQEIFQKDESYDNQNALQIPEYFENNDLKAQLQDKNTTKCNGYPRKGQKSKPKRQNRARERKDREKSKRQNQKFVKIESFKSSTQHSSVNDFVVINIPEEDVEPKQIILDPDDQSMWESAKTVAPTPNSAIIQLDVDDNFVNS
ncbi:hypothetical protein Tco_1427666 [Tanacetum coccineum]